MRRALLLFAGVLLGLAAVGPAAAHEMRPSLLELTPRVDGLVDMVFRIGFARGVPMPLEARLPAHCRSRGAPTVHDAPPVRTVRRVVDCGAQGLVGAVRVDGLGQTGTEVILRAPGTTAVLRPDTPSTTLTAESRPSGRHGALTAYVAIGVEHIWLGPDHLLFVLGLVLLVGRRTRLLLATITAFTVAHSVTLALATLGLVVLPSGPVEAVIAASIVLLAVELIRPGAQQGQGAEPSWAARAPWVFALGCGLLHGFGFAGVLSEVGLPPDAVPAALFGFNLGVELGQLAFVGAALALGALAGRLRLSSARPALIYAMGTVGAFWVWDRAWPILSIWG